MNVYPAVQRRSDLFTISPTLTIPTDATKGFATVALAADAPKAAEKKTQTGSNLARFWELRGRRVFEKNGVVWGHYRGPFYSPLPLHLNLDADAEEVRDIFRSSSVRGLRFASVNRPGLPSGTYVCRPQGYDLQSVHRKQRGNVIRGLDECEMRTVDPERLLTEGMQLNQDTLVRQGRQDDTFLDPAKWKQFVDAVSRCPGMTVHGAFVDGRLSAYLISCRDGEWLHLLYKMSRAADLEHKPNHALDYSIIRDAAAVPGIEYVASGNLAVIEHEGLARYKRQMGYDVAVHNLCIHFHPSFAPLVQNKLTVAATRKLAAKFPENQKLNYRARILEGSLTSVAKPAEPTASEDLCQQEEALGFSRLLRPASLFPALRMLQTLRKGGPKMMVNRGIDYLRRRVKRSGRKPAATRAPLAPEEVLQLQPGDWVVVKSLEQIRATLDERGKNRGLLFTDDMRGFAGQRFRVFKRVESIFLEESKQRRTLKNTVILETAYCPGITFRCDRSCFLFWKEVWLEREDVPQDRRHFALQGQSPN